jgi:hypothetical protein
MSGTGRRWSTRTGAAAAAVILMLVIAELLITSAVLGSALDQDATLGRIESLRAFYAAEAGLNMSVRELMVGADENGDGTIGTVSNDGSATSDTTLEGGATFSVTISAGSPSLVVSSGSAGTARQVIEVNAQ